MMHMSNVCETTCSLLLKKNTFEPDTVDLISSGRKHPFILLTFPLLYCDISDTAVTYITPLLVCTRSFINTSHLFRTHNLHRPVSYIKVAYQKVAAQT